MHKDIYYDYIDVNSVAGRLVRNPNYGGPSVSLNGWHWLPEISKAQKPGFREALEVSVRQEGVRNPILVWSLPEGLFLTFGGSRLLACRATDRVWCPAIINDYTGDFKDSEIVTQENWRKFFRDPPRDVEFGEYGFDYHYNLERARRDQHDEAGFAWVEGAQDQAKAPGWMSKEFPWVYK
jgi:hypothetical protein